ncbi:MAG: acyl-CoA dehydrogenase family protein [Acidimicrobiia bacterium]|nr:acyl-CoA dehydrogenase family protein [Acidimicrobiia bacterium]
MDIGDSAAEAAFRTEARTWLATHATPRRGAAATGDLEAHVARAMVWQRVLHDHGWAGLSWPEQFGGRGMSSGLSSIFNEEMAGFEETTGPLTVAVGMVGPTLMAHGTPGQQEHLAAILRGDELWCQLFSEPGAGSDLATLSTRAVRDGDTWIVSGQKVWTSLAQFADYGILLARTDTDVPKHAGLTYFIVDMNDPGIEIRPLVQMTGHAHFNETFLDEVRIPHENVVGVVGDGWSIARTTLNSERSSIAGGGAGWSVEALIAAARTMGVAADPLVRQELAAAHSRALTLTAMGYRVRSAVSRGRLPGAEALAMKLGYANHWVATMDTAMRILGADGLLYALEAGEETSRDSAGAPSLGSSWQHALLNQFAIRLGGGTDEVQRNIIGELGLGLPREPSADRGVPWKDLPR